jgi:hypothetical protein
MGDRKTQEQRAREGARAGQDGVWCVHASEPRQQSAASQRERIASARLTDLTAAPARIRHSLSRK